MKRVCTTAKSIVCILLCFTIYFHPKISFADTRTVNDVLQNADLTMSSSTSTTLIPFNSEWRYIDNGSNQGDTWRAVTFNDINWKTGNGKFGYGVPQLNTVFTLSDVKKGVKGVPITSYFRKEISIPNSLIFGSYSVKVNRNDGIVVYVNGTEVYRNNMPSKSINFKTLASTTVTGDGPIEFAIKASAFKSGSNVVAVEIHQASSASNDLSFDMELIANHELTPPTVTSINRFNPTEATTSASEVTFRATFSEPVNGVDATDFELNLAESLTGMITSFEAVGSNRTAYDIVVKNLRGSGTLQLNLKSSGTGITDDAGNAIRSGYTTGQSYSIQFPTLNGFGSITKLNSFTVTANTGEKPQSKVWNYAGKYWMVMPNSTGTHLWRLDGETWTSTLKLSNATVTAADCKPKGNTVHILLYSGQASELVSVEFNTATGAYQPWSANATTVPITLEKGVETATIDIDGTGRMWLASDAATTIHVRWSDAPYTSWSSPITLATNVTTDDICAVIAMPGKIGVIWSDQTTKRFGFRYHNDNSSPDSWSAAEIPASQSAVEVGGGMADDHLNMAVASDGTLYCVVKTSYNTSGYERLALLVRRPDGTWDNIYRVAGGGTRPIVVLNEKLGIIRVAYTSADQGGDILYKESYTSNINFGPILTLMSGGTFNNVSSTKDNYTSDIVFLAGNGTMAVSVLATESPSALLAAQQQTSTLGGSNGLNTENFESEANSILAFPNPFTKDLSIRLTSKEVKKVTVQLQSVNGREVYKSYITLKEGLNDVSLPLQHLTRGMYILRIESNGISKSYKVMKSQ